MKLPEDIMEVLRGLPECYPAVASTEAQRVLGHCGMAISKALSLAAEGRYAAAGRALRDTSEGVAGAALLLRMAHAVEEPGA